MCTLKMLSQKLMNESTNKQNIVTIGGGTGSFVLLSGLRSYKDFFNISAIVSMADDGGSTGKLRDELGVLPPGDVRQCLVALSDSSEKMRELMNYRFESGSLAGHSFGNILLSGLEKVYGGFALGVEQAEKILNVCGKVIPVTKEKITLTMKLSDGSNVRGEDAIGNTNVEQIGIEEVSYTSIPEANTQALIAIQNADYILIGPGDHYTSVIPNLLVQDISLSIAGSKAKVIYIVNLVNKKGHTSNWTVKDYVDDIEKYIGVGRVATVILNTRETNTEVLSAYKQEYGPGIEVKLGTKMSPHVYILAADVISESVAKTGSADPIASTRSVIRHDSRKLARTIFDYLCR